MGSLLRTSLSAVFFIATVTQLAVADLDSKWESYKAKFGKFYSSEEDEVRKEAFFSADMYIEEQNLLGHSWSLEHNENSDLIADEISAKTYHQLADMLPSRVETAYNQNSPIVIPPLIINPPPNPEIPLPVPLAVLPPSDMFDNLTAEFDYRNDTCMPPVKYHANSLCIADWAFAAITPIEYNLCKKTGFSYDLSEQQLIDCEFNGNGCSGGRFMHAWLHLLSKGSALENYYPYQQSGAFVCKSVPFYGIGAQITQYAYVNGDANATEKALVEHGPLATEIFAPLSFIYYRNGLYDDPLCGSSNMHVALVIVGYGTNNEGVPYWIVRNSWGTNWGQNGYMTIRRGVNRCGIEYYAAYVKVA